MLAIVVKRNLFQAASHLSSEMCESWRQVMEVTLHAMLQDGVKREMKLAVIFEVIQDLLLKVRERGSTLSLVGTMLAIASGTDELHCSCLLIQSFSAERITLTGDFGKKFKHRCGTSAQQRERLGLGVAQTLVSSGAIVSAGRCHQSSPSQLSEFYA